MSRGTPTGTRETKGERTERLILEEALRLFAERGFDATTMRDIAEAAGCSPGLAYRYFARKEELVAALYGKLADELEAGVADIPPGPLADRLRAALALHRELIAPHRRTLIAVMGLAFDPTSEIGVLGEGTHGIRARTVATLRVVVDGATDAPPPALRPAVTRALHALHLLLVLLLFQDRSRGQKTAVAAAELACDLVRLGGPFLALPMAQGALARVDDVLRPLLGEEPASPRRASTTSRRKRAQPPRPSRGTRRDEEN